MKKKNTWNIRQLAITHLSQQPSILYQRLSDFRFHKRSPPQEFIRRTLAHTQNCTSAPPHPCGRSGPQRIESAHLNLNFAIGPDHRHDYGVKCTIKAGRTGRQGRQGQQAGLTGREGKGWMAVVQAGQLRGDISPFPPFFQPTLAF